MSDAVMVPREPTEAMLDAGALVESGGKPPFGYETQNAAAIWEAMLAASPSVGGWEGSRPQEAVPPEGQDAAVLDRVQWLCEGAQPSDYGAVIAAIRDVVLPPSHDELLCTLTEMLAAFRGAVLLTADDELQRCAEKAEALITKITEGA